MAVIATAGRGIAADGATPGQADAAALARPDAAPTPARPALPPRLVPAGAGRVQAFPAAQPAPFPADILAPPVAPPAPSARPRGRHWALLASLLLLVVVPAALWAGYLWTRASDQFTSTIGFSVRREEAPPTMDVFGGMLGGRFSGTASDTDILYQFIRSPDLVLRIDRQLDIRAMFSRNWPQDFAFAFDPSGTIEDLTGYWRRQLRVHYDDSAGIITLRVSAFTPQDAQAIAEAVFAESERVVNALSEQARDDATRHASAELEKTRTLLAGARQAMTGFRIRTGIVDPTAELEAQATVTTALQAQLAEARVALDTLRRNARAGDHRITQAELRIESLRHQIQQERGRSTGIGAQGDSYAQLIADYEQLKVDLEFAESAYQSARTAHEAALQTAQRQSRYLAAHILPTLAERSLLPSRPWLLALGTGILFGLWSILALAYYSLRDRR